MYIKTQGPRGVQRTRKRRCLPYTFTRSFLLKCSRAGMSRSDATIGVSAQKTMRYLYASRLTCDTPSWLAVPAMIYTVC